MKKLLFSTQNYQYLKNELLSKGDFEDGQVEVKYFPDGERYQRILSDVSKREVILVGGTISDSDTLEFYDLACALVKHGATMLIMAVPYFGYSTMERAIKKGEVVTAKTRARLLSVIPQTASGNHLILFDLHSEGLPHYFEGNIHTVHVYCKELVIEASRELGGNNFVLACTDAGRAKWVESLANDMHVEPAFVFKRRLSGESTEVTGINADVSGKKVIIYDDMIRTGGSLINAAKSYKDAGAEEIFAITTHGLFNNNGLDRIRNSGFFTSLVSTNTHPNAVQLADDFLKIKSVDKLLLKTLGEL